MQTSAFFAKLKDSPRPVVLDLWAPWCAPCRAMEPALQQMERKYEGQVEVWKINADQSPEVLRALKVMSIPTTIGFAQGQEIIRKSGLQSPESLDILFDATLHQRSNVILPPAPADRWIRSITGLILLVLGASFGPSILLLAAGGVVLFSAFYDRCPIFRALAPRLATLFKKTPKAASQE